MDVHIGAVNCCVHIVMYSYYFLSSFKTLSPKLSTIKPIITIIQLTQLVAIFGQSVAAVLPSCSASKLFYLQIANALVLIYFFARFYIENFLKKKQH